MSDKQAERAIAALEAIADQLRALVAVQAHAALDQAQSPTKLVKRMNEEFERVSADIKRRKHG